MRVSGGHLCEAEAPTEAAAETSLSYPHRSANFLGYNNTTKVVNSSNNSCCFHYIILLLKRPLCVKGAVTVGDWGIVFSQSGRLSSKCNIPKDLKRRFPIKAFSCSSINQIGKHKETQEARPHVSYLWVIYSPLTAFIIKFPISVLSTVFPLKYSEP